MKGKPLLAANGSLLDLSRLDDKEVTYTVDVTGGRVWVINYVTVVRVTNLVAFQFPPSQTCQARGPCKSMT